ncbi:hypothetical protein BDV18DRAFT_84898 [Aspergillus unguis]
MELTWLADTPQSRRRTRAPRACSDCRKRKKRCRHLHGPEAPKRGRTLSAGVSTSSKNIEGTGSSSQSLGGPQALNVPIELEGHRPSPSESQIERFVGDLNPEAAIREKVDAPDGAHLRDRVGLWINKPIRQPCGENGNGNSHSARISAEIPVHKCETQSVASTLDRRYLLALSACNRLPRSTFDHLAAIYFSRINHILPVVDHEAFNAGHTERTTSVFLERAICLVAAKDKSAGSHLRFSDTTDAPTDVHTFCSEIYNGLVCAMEAGLEQDRTTRIRIFALMSLHSEGYEGAEAASMHLCQAIHQAQTAGLHLERPNRLPGDALTTLFWCLWAMDKMHACLGGRPVLLADRDIGIKRHEGIPHHSKPAFDVWLRLSELLSTVISFYRPSADDTTGWEMTYPSFEEIVGDHARKDIDYATLGILELYYHAISVLSCRYRPFYRSRSFEPSYTRQGLAAVRINSLVTSECAQTLPPLPIVPYAVSLSMGVSYQQFRSSRLITHFERAKSSLETCCGSLEKLGAYWYSAEAMARLGRKALRQIDGTSYEGDSNRSPNRSPLLPAMTNSDGRSFTRSTPSATNPEIAKSSMPMTTSLCEARPDLGDNSPVAMAPEHAMDGIEGQHDKYLEASGGDGFADIDTLFDDFLDLSLPTNFWDPVFFSAEHKNDV